jgi:polyhydroxyalkanoate synthesis regulator phasin
MTNTTTMQKIEAATIARMMRELQSDLADLVESGDLTAEQANEWANDKADQWSNGVG